MHVVYSYKNYLVLGEASLVAIVGKDKLSNSLPSAIHPLANILQKRDRDRQTDKQTDRQTDRDKEEDRNSDRQRQRQRGKDRERDRQRKTETVTGRGRDIETETEERRNIKHQDNKSLSRWHFLIGYWCTTFTPDEA